MKRALLIVDMSNDFLPESLDNGLELGRGAELVPRIRRLEETFLACRQPVIYVTDRHLKADFELDKWGPHSMKGKEGSRIVQGLVTDGMRVLERSWTAGDIEAIKEGELLFEVEKGSYSGFTDNGGTPTAMDGLLKKLGFAAGDKLCVTGVHTNCCVKQAAADAWFRGYVPVIVKDCVDAFEDPNGRVGMGQEAALDYMRHWYDAEIKSSEEVEAETRAGGHTAPLIPQ